MWRFTLAAATFFGFISLVGCGESSTEPSASSPRKPPAFGTGGLGKTPAEAVHAFLSAVKDGDEETASQLLTPLAREKTKEMEMEVAPPGSQTAQFAIGDVEQINEEIAHVASTWSDVDEEGTPHQDSIIWLLRREAEGWRIGGMATKIFDDEPPLYLNFEDPEEMIRKQMLVEQEIQRRFNSDQQASQPPAGQPGAPDTGVIR